MLPTRPPPTRLSFTQTEFGPDLGWLSGSSLSPLNRGSKVYMSAPAEHDYYVPEPIVHDKFRVRRITGLIGKNRLCSQTLVFWWFKIFILLSAHKSHLAGNISRLPHTLPDFFTCLVYCADRGLMHPKFLASCCPSLATINHANHIHLLC